MGSVKATKSSRIAEMMGIGPPFLSLREGAEGMLRCRASAASTMAAAPNSPQSVRSATRPQCPSAYYKYVQYLGVAPPERALRSPPKQSAYWNTKSGKAAAARREKIAVLEELLQKLRRRRRREHARQARTAFSKLAPDDNWTLPRGRLDNTAFDDIVRECLGDQGTDISFFLDAWKKERVSIWGFVLGCSDSDGDRRISCNEFEEFTWHLETMLADSEVETDFVLATLDPDRDVGEFFEFESLFNFQSRRAMKNSSKEYVASVIKELDEDNDGNLALTEYRRWCLLNSVLFSELFDEPISSRDEALPFSPEGKRALHRPWASQAYRRLDVGTGNVTRSDLACERCAGLMAECLPGRPFELPGALPLVDLLLKKVDEEGDYKVGFEEFEILTYKLKRFASEAVVAPAAATPKWSPGTVNPTKAKEPRPRPSMEQQQTVMWNKLRRRRRKEHARWAAVAFKKLDLDENGLLSRKELGAKTFFECVKECLGDHSLHCLDCANLNHLVNFVMGVADENKDQHLSLTEFQSFTWNMKNMTSEVDFESDFIFALFDLDNNGRIDFDEFERLFKFHVGEKRGSSKEYIAEVMRELDEDEDGTVSRQEYRNWGRRISKEGECSSNLDASSSSSPTAAAEPLTSPEQRQTDHKTWACEVFASMQPTLDANDVGYISRHDLASEIFLEAIQDCVPGRPASSGALLASADFLLKRNADDGDYRITSEEFTLLTWKLKRLEGIARKGSSRPVPSPKAKRSKSPQNAISTKRSQSPYEPLHKI